MATKGKHLIIATGGTGGHFYPALAIALEHERQGGVVTLLVAGHNTARHLETARKAGLAAFACSAPRPPGGLLGRVAFPVQFLRACLGARRLIKRLRPDLVLGMGSFACVPVCLMAARARVPLFLHEGNAMVGRANLFLSRRARLLAASLPLVPGQKCRCPTRLTGMPLRPEILRVAAIPCDRAKTGESFGFTERKPVLLVFGFRTEAGSAGVRRQPRRRVPQRGHDPRARPSRRPCRPPASHSPDRCRRQPRVGAGLLAGRDAGVRACL